MTKNQKGRGFAIGAAIGAVAGVVTGILFAPKSGKETREDIKEAAHGAKEKLIAEADKIHNELSELIASFEASAAKKGTQLLEKVKEALDHANKARENLATKIAALKAGEDTEDKDLKRALKKAQEAQTALAKFLKK